MRIALHWFRRDLRLRDNRALARACREYDAVVPVFVLDPHIIDAADRGAQRVRFLLEALRSLEADLTRKRSPLLVLRGQPEREIPRLTARIGAAGVTAARDHGPYARRRDERVAAALLRQEVAFDLVDDQLLVAPEESLKADGTPYTVYTPFARRWRGVAKERPERMPPFKPATSVVLKKLPRGGLPELRDLGLAPCEGETGSERQALRRLDAFIEDGLLRYKSRRDRPSVAGTSMLSPHLKFGTVSPRTVHWRAADVIGAEISDLDPARPAGRLSTGARERLAEGGVFLNELAWREFYQSILFHFPGVACGPFQARFAKFTWPEADPEIVERWRDGLTGFPIVDAGMRQLAATGWMHNRLRMITAVFLTKTLLVDWRVGERIFMQRLVDGDLAANNGGWQWCASTGTDASPWFRIFNPMTQSKKFDPDGEYIRHWVPELADAPASAIHEPWNEPLFRASAGYPEPCVDYAEQRKIALDLLGAAGKDGASGA